MADQRAEATDRTCANSMVETLIAHGLNTIYGLPGIQNDWFFNALHDAGDKVRVVHTRHEQGAAYMALGASLATGKPSVYSVVPGPGVLNSTAALATAYSTNSPVLCLTGQIPSRAIGEGYGLLHEIPDQLGILERLTKKASRVEEPEKAASALADAIHSLTEGRPRPVALEIPPDILARRGDFAAASPLPASPTPEPDAGAIADAARLIAAAKRPMIFVGGGAREASAPVRQLAELIGAPVCSVRMGRGVLDDRHDLSMMVPAAQLYWKECDLAIGIGTRLQQPVQVWGTDDAIKFVRIDVDPKQMSIVRSGDVNIEGRAEDVLPALNDELQRIGGLSPVPASHLADLKDEARRGMADLSPQLGFLQAIRDALGEDGVLVEELTQVGYVSRFGFPVYRPRTFISTGYQGTLGWGYATALGVQHALPGVPVVSINGDGGFMFTVQEIATAVRHNIPLVAVVFNDGAYGNVRRMQQKLYGNRVIATDLVNPDFMALAKSFGIGAYRAADPDALRKTLDRALKAGEPALVEVPVGTMPDPFRYIMSPRIRGA